MKDLPVIVGVFFIGIVALGLIALLSFYDHVVPSEISSLPGVALGILGGAYMATTRKSPPTE